VHALTLARKRIRARIQSPATPPPVRLAHALVEAGRGRSLPLLSSPLAREIMASGYTAAALERIYSDRCEGGLVARMADRMVLDAPTQQALRERFAATAGEIRAGAALAARAGVAEFRMLLAPCGLAAEARAAAESLTDRPEVRERLRCWGVDPDPSGAILPEAARLARQAGLPAEFIREDLRRCREVDAVAARVGGFHLVSCVGLPQALGMGDVERLLGYYAQRLLPGGTLLIDAWQPSDATKLTQGLGARPAACPVAALRHALARAGLSVEREHPTGEGGCVLLVARKN
jgi:hypothetical protein